MNPRVYEKSFNESWAYASALKDELKASSYDVQPFPGTFKSGRPRWMATFLSADRKVMARRIGMELTSGRTGAGYKVFSRQEWVDRDTAPPRAILNRQQTDLPGPSGRGGSPHSDADAVDVLNEIYAEA